MAHMAGMIAEEIGVDKRVAKTATLLHDMDNVRLNGYLFHVVKIMTKIRSFHEFSDNICAAVNKKIKRRHPSPIRRKIRQDEGREWGSKDNKKACRVLLNRLRIFSYGYRLIERQLKWNQREQPLPPSLKPFLLPFW